MEAIYKKNFLISAKSKHHHRQYTKLIIPEQQIYCNHPRQLYEILVSQYATILKQDTFSIIQHSKQKIPMPIAFACLKKSLDTSTMQQTLLILHRYLEKHYQVNNHIIYFNIALLYKTIGNLRKSLFYLQLLLKENPIFEDGIYQYCSIILNDGRNDEVIRMINRYLTGQLSNSQKLQSLYINVVSKSSQTHHKPLLNFFHKKKISPIVSYNLGIFLIKINQYRKAIQVFHQLQQLLITFDHQNNTLKSKKFLTLVRINLFKLYQPQVQYSGKCQEIKKLIQNNLLDGHFNIQVTNTLYNTKTSKKQNCFLETLKLQSQRSKNIQRFDNQISECRKSNRKKLLYLLKKQQKINKFFKRVKIQKLNSTTHFSILNQKIINQAKIQLNNEKNQQFQQFQKQFEQKKKIHQINYSHQELQNIIANYFNKDIKKQKRQSHVQRKDAYSSQKNKFRIKKGNIITQKLIQPKSIDKKTTKLPEQSQILFDDIEFTKKSQQHSKQDPNIIQQTQFKKSLNVGMQLQNNNKWQQAYQHYLKMYKQYKKSEQKQQILIKIAKTFQIFQNYIDAQKTYLKCCKYNNAKAFLNLGCLLIKLNRINQGVQNIEKANCIQRFNTQIQTKLVYGYSLIQSTIQKAYSLATNILKRNPQSLQTLIMTANILQKQGKFKQALQIAQAIDRYQQSFDMKHYIGLLYLNDSNVKMAYQYFQNALKIKPDHTPSLIQIATIISDVKPNEAINILKKVLQYDPNNLLALARLGKIYQSIQQDYDNAMITYKKSLDVEKNYESYIKIGDVFRKKESVMEAYVNYKQALSLKQTSQVYEKLAQIYQYQKQYKKAYDYYQLSLGALDLEKEIFEQKKRILQSLGRSALLNKDFQNSITALNEALQIEQSFSLFIKLGDAYYGKGQYTQALNNYQKCLKVDGESNNIEVMQKLALCFDRKQQYLASKSIYQKLISLDSSNIRWLTNLANILLIIGNTNQAFYWFETMLLKAPNNLQKRIKIADIYATLGDWSKVQNHLLICYKQKQNDVRVIERLINLYKQKRQLKLLQKFEKKLGLLKGIKR